MAIAYFIYECVCVCACVDVWPERLPVSPQPFPLHNNRTVAIYELICDVMVGWKLSFVFVCTRFLIVMGKNKDSNSLFPILTFIPIPISRH